MTVSMDTPAPLELDIQTAVDAIGFGKFNVKVMVLCGLIYMNTGFSISSIGLVLPSAACDFSMSTVDKGRLSAIPMLGMMCGSYFWGCLADVKGRKPALTAALLLHGGFEFLSSFVPNYWCFLFLKYLSGFSISGQSGLVFTFLGEFQPTKYRHKILCWLESAWTVGLILSPLVGWAIIPLKISLDFRPFFFHSWNLFVLMCSLPSITIGVWILFFPETPKYLAESNQVTKLFDVLCRMYSENTGNPSEEYLRKNVKDGLSMSDVLKTMETNVKQNGETKSKNDTMGKVLRVLGVQSLNLFRRPYLKRSLNILVLMFFVTSSYYTLMLWFPELFQRFAQFEIQYPGQSVSICKISEYLHADNETTIMQNVAIDCELEVQTNVFLHTLILGFACVPLSILLPLTIDRVGYKCYLVICSVLSIATAIGLFFIKSSTANLGLSCIFEATLSVCMSIVFCVIVDIYPTGLRVLAASLTACCARLGALIGTSMFGYLIDNYCVTVIVIIIGQLLICLISSLFIPSKQNMKQTQVPPVAA